MNSNKLRDLEYLKQNYEPAEIQKLLNSSKIKREVYQELKVSEYVLNNYIKHYKLSDTNKQEQRPINKNSIENEKPQKVSVDNSVFQEIEDPVESFQEKLARKKEARTLKELRDPYY
jgi:ribosome biogenesis GTPase A